MKNIYLIPGHGSDHRLFRDLQTPGFRQQQIELVTPRKGEKLPTYATRLAEQIDPSVPFVLLGVSFGGMNAVEISKILRPEKVVLISSAKDRSELPLRYRLLKHFPLYQLFPGRFYRFMTHVMRPLVEPDYRREKDLFRVMTEDKDPVFMKRAIHCIVNWENSQRPENLFHIHGTADRTLPYRLIKDGIPVKGGSHMMALTDTVKINQLLETVLLN